MLNTILKASLYNRPFVLLAYLILTSYGVYVALNIEVDVFPDLTAPTVVVLTEAHGMAPEEVERLITFKVETSVNGATDVRRVRSSSSTGFSLVWVEFDWGTDIYRARQIVAEKVSALNGQLPEGVGVPVLAPQSSIMGEIMLISVTSEKRSMMEVRSTSDWNIRPALLSIGGVSQVVVIGGDYKQYQIQASPLKMSYYGVSLDDLLKTSKNLSQNAAGGLMNAYYQEYTITGIGKTNDIGELGRSVIKVVNGQPVKLEDVADVRITSAFKKGDGSMNGSAAVIMTVQKQPNTNTLFLSEEIERTMTELSASLPSDIVINTDIFRQADFIEASIDNINKTLIEGMIFVVLVIALFLMNTRATIISIVTIPISLIVTVLTLKLLGYSLNTMSLGGMAIAIGALVDDAIIDVENVLKRLKENILKPASEQCSKIQIILEASVEIRPSVISATFIIIAAFLPLFLLSGIEGRLLKPLGIAFIVSLFASLIVAITLTPVLCSYLLAKDEVLKRHEKENRLTVFLKRIYESSLETALEHKKAVIVTSAILLLVSLIFLFNLGRSFLPEFNEGSLVITAVTLPGTSLDESNRMGAMLEKALLTVPEVKVTSRRTGRAELDEHAFGVNTSEIEVPFELGDRNRYEFLNDVRSKLSGISGMSITVGQPISHRIDHMLSGTRANIAIKLFGDDLNKLYSKANQIRESISSVDGLVDLSVEQQVEIPQIQIKANREMLARYGIPLSQFMEYVDVAFSGEVVGQVYEGSMNFDMVLRLGDQNNSSIESIREALIDTYSGEKIPLYYVADIVSSSGPSTINREALQRKIVISANVAGRDQSSTAEEIRKKIRDKIKLDKDYRIEIGGQFEAEEEASKTLLIMSAFSLLIVFLLLYNEFKDSLITGVILINLPLALIGGVFSIIITGGIISIPSIIGFITLFGIATRNGILLISRYSALEKEGVGLYERIIGGSADRLAPILMTALAAGLALIPLAIAGDAPGNEIQSPMAKVILGGLLTSTFLNLIVVPVVYSILKTNRAKK